MHTRVVALPTQDLGQVAVDQPVDDPLTVLWQVPLTGFHTRATRLDQVAGVAVLIDAEHGVLTPKAAPPDLGSDLWPVPVQVAGSASSGQMMLVDRSSMVYRLSPGQPPVPVWRSDRHPGEVHVNGLSGGRLVSVCDQDSCPRTDLVDEASGRIVWTKPCYLSPPLVVGEGLIGSCYDGETDSFASLDAPTGEQLWRRDNLRPSPNLVGVADELLWSTGSELSHSTGSPWSTESLTGKLSAFDVRTGKSATTVPLPRLPRLSGLLDQAGQLHIVDEQAWTVVDLTSATVVSDAPFDAPEMGSVYAKRIVRTADGRLVLADDRGQVFVVHPDRPDKPELVATCPPIKGIGIAAGHIVVLSHDGTLTALGAS